MIRNRLQIKDSVFDPEAEENSVYYYTGSDGKRRYKVWIYLDGRDTPYVDYVVYQLHSIFANPFKKVKRKMSNANCSLKIWTWGTFEVEVRIHLKNGDEIRGVHHLNFDREMQPGVVYKEINPNDVSPWAESFAS